MRGSDASPDPTMMRIHFQGSPAKKTTESPAAATRMAVPRSGCFIISATGIPMITKAIAKSLGEVWSWRLWKYQASIIVSATFISSEG